MSLKASQHHPVHHGQHRPALANITRSQVAKRRSTRMGLSASVGLSGEDRHKCSFTTAAKASHLNKHGAAVQLDRELLVGSTILVRNARGTQLCARVVAKLAALQGVPTYGIEFVEQDDTAKNFWGITFPSVENRPAAQVAEQVAARRRRTPSPLES
jgi:hypothetical protein